MLAIAILLVTLAWISLTPEIASSQQAESRINNLELDLRNIESRLNQLESQINRSGVNPRIPPTNTPGRNQPLRRSQTFDNLANLVIETRQDVKQLKTRVSKLESQTTSRTR